MCANEYTCILFKLGREGSCSASSYASSSFMAKDFKSYIFVRIFLVSYTICKPSFLFEIEVVVVVNALIFFKSNLVKHPLYQLI